MERTVPCPAINRQPCSPDYLSQKLNQASDLALSRDTAPRAQHVFVAACHHSNECDVPRSVHARTMHTSDPTHACGMRALHACLHVMCARLVCVCVCDLHARLRAVRKHACVRDACLACVCACMCLCVPMRKSTCLCVFVCLCMHVACSRVCIHACEGICMCAGCASIHTRASISAPCAHTCTRARTFASVCSLFL